MIHFQYPLYFLLLIPAIWIIIFLYFNSWKKNVFGPMDDLKIIFKTNTFYYKLYYFFIFLVFLTFILIFSQPVITDMREKNIKNWIDIQIVMDVSYSMIAEDLKPNRLTVAKDVIKDFLWEIKTDRVWIIIFAGKTFTSLPLNFDYNIVKKIVDKITVDTINQRYTHMQWTAMWDALMLAAESFDNKQDREKVIIFLTDWEANKWINPIIALNFLKENNPDIKVYTIWIWWNEETTIAVKDNFWRTQRLPIAAVDEKTLKAIAEWTKWKYFRATDKETFREIFSEISKLEKKEITTEIVKINKEKYTYFLYSAIFIFFCFLFIKYRKRI